MKTTRVVPVLFVGVFLLVLSGVARAGALAPIQYDSKGNVIYKLEGSKIVPGKGYQLRQIDSTHVQIVPMAPGGGGSAVGGTCGCRVSGSGADCSGGCSSSNGGCSGSCDGMGCSSSSCGWGSGSVQ